MDDQSNFFDKPKSRSRIVPRHYQVQDHDESFRLWDSGVIGVLTRAFTGGGKTLMSCLKADTWLQRGDNHYVMVISYETQLVRQFAQEIQDYLGIDPGIEMEAESIRPRDVPRIVVASRQTLLRSKVPTVEQLEELREFGITDTDVGAAPSRKCKTCLNHLRKGIDPQIVIDHLEELNSMPEARDGYWSRVHKFDRNLNWLLIWDEAHRHAKHLGGVGHVVDWFCRNPNTRMSGPTATPKRGDGISIGDQMFPGIALDYPLYSINKPCAVKEGYAVPYVQKYISVEGVDFKSIKRVTEGGDFDEADLERVLGEEGQLAKLVEPMLDMVGNRRTLIFSPGVEMSKNVARYINARVEAKCKCCSIVKWYPSLLVDNGAECPCGQQITVDCITKSGEQAKQLDGMSRDKDRRATYDGHQGGAFQFLSVCGLCREGYNDPDIACVAVFRPVSKKASSLAEQMKGRGCRPLRAIAGILHTFATAEERVQAIAESSKPNCLIVDLVGITGLADCASTAEIYAEGLPDVIKQRAEEILAEQGLDEEIGVEDAIEQAKREDEESRERIRLEREAAEKRAKEESERRAKADAQVTYTTHEVGYGSSDPSVASVKMVNYIRFLGMEFLGIEVSRRVAGRIIDQLKRRVDPAEVARTNRIQPDQWKLVPPSLKQINWLNWKQINSSLAKTPRDASLLIDAKANPDKLEGDFMDEIRSCKTLEELNGIGKSLAMVRAIIPRQMFERIVQAGVKRKNALTPREPGCDDF